EAARTTSPAPAPADAALPPTETYQSRPATTRVVPISGAPSPQPAGASPGRVKASPLAKKIASQSGVDLRMLQGSGPGGRIVRSDVEAAMAAPRPTAQPERPAAASLPAARPALVIPPRPETEYEDIALTPMRAAIAKQMPLSKAPVPHFYVTSDVAMDRA